MEHRGILRTHSTLFSFFQQLLDCFVVLFSALVAHRIYVGSWGMEGVYALLIGLVVLLNVFLFQQFALYRTWRGNSLYQEIGSVSLAWITVLLLTTAYVFVNKVGILYSRGWMGMWAILGWTNLVITRVAVRLVQRQLRIYGYNSRSVVIVGDIEFSLRVANHVLVSPWIGFKIIGLFSNQIVPWPNSSSAIPVLGRIVDLQVYVQQTGVDQIWLTLPLREEVAIKNLLHDLRHCTADIRFIPDIFAFQLLNHSISEIAGFPVIDLSITPMVGINNAIKTLQDFVLAPIALLLVGPLLILIALAIKIGSPGPVIFRQPRMGMDGRIFTVFKFRTMFVHREEQGTITQASRSDVRVTRLGAFLRRFSLDELPQLINVLRGEMSLVGPRPHAIQHNELYKDAVQRYMLRHKVKPGMTGWAQVNGWRGESDTLEKMQKRVEFDLYYIEHWSLGFDLWILVLTVLKGFFNKNAF